MQTSKRTSHKKIDIHSDFTQDKRILLLSCMAILIGVMSTFVAAALVWLISVISNFAFYQIYDTVLRSPKYHHLGYYVVLVPVIGGLIVGLIARYGSEKIRGHGIPEALEAILFGRSRMDLKVAILKPLSSAISIGTGGPFGAEGPIIMTGGAFASLFAQFFHLSAAERKTLLVAGAAGGMSAIFAAPIAAILLAIELLLFEWKPRSFIPVAISSMVAGTLRVPILGNGPIFEVIPHSSIPQEILLIAFVVGIAAGLVSGILTYLVYSFEDMFERLPVHWMWWPALGGLFIGIGGLVDPRVLGVGYDTIHDLLKGNIIGSALLGLFIGKCLVWSISLGSGTSGGVLAPLLMMGGALGALEAHILPSGDIGLWATIGMAAMMSGTMRSPLTGSIFAIELTHDFNLLPAVFIGSIGAYLTTVLLMRRSILTQKVAHRGYHITREYSVDPLSMIRVNDVMDKNPLIIPSSMKVSELSNRIADLDPYLMRRHGILIVDENKNLVGIITRGDLVRIVQKGINSETTVLEAGNRDIVVTFPDEPLADAVAKMVQNNIGRLPVVSREDKEHIMGYIGRGSILTARQRHLEEEKLREKSFSINPDLSLQ